MAKRKRVSDTRRKVMRVVYTIFGAFAVGYFPVYFLLRKGGPQISMVALALLVIPYGARASSVTRGLLLGAAMGFWGGLAISGAMIHRGAYNDRLMVVSLLGTTFICAVVSALFAYMTRRRAEHAEQQWD